MQHTRFDVRFRETGLDESHWSAVGTDDAEFFVSPNVGEELRPLARVASGGELSRIMLAVKTLSAGGESSTAASSLVFDEVDAGIGGRVADVVGSKLRALGGRRQVLCITHLPQIAAHADAHYHVAKAVEGERTVVRVERLGPSERVDEIGRMLAGVPVTSATRAAAAEMLSVRSAARKGESESESKPKGETARRRATNPARLARRLS
jgi:DNA repair protein RecN (Recombination protein N)